MERQRRRHPARRARLVTGAAGAAGMLVLAGWFAVDASSSPSAGAGSTSAGPSQSPTTTTIGRSSAPTRRSNRSTNRSAQPATPSGRATTSTRGS